MTLTFLGTGTSHGVPVIACRCPVCRSTDPRDRRYRTSLLVREGEDSVVVDAGPEFRLQAIRAEIERIDALLLTHAHADHVHGLDDIRPLSWSRPLPVYSDAECAAELRERFSYAFRQGGQLGGGRPRMELREPEKSFAVGRITIEPLPIRHGGMAILGWKFGDFAWMSDCSGIPAETMAVLRGSGGIPTRRLAIGGLRAKPHPTHFSVAEAIAAARDIGAKETWIIHLTHDHPHEELEAMCRRLGADVGARPAWDGLVLDEEHGDIAFGENHR